MTNKKSIWSKLTGLSEDELEKETWQEGEMVEESQLDEMEKCIEKTEPVENDNEAIFALEKDEIEDKKSLLKIDESWSIDSDGQLGVDVYRNGDKVIVKSAIAGVKQKDLDITISSDTVTICGSREEKSKVKEKDYFYQECYWGKFSRSVVLPFDIDEAKSKAKLEDGILTVTLPIIKEEKKTKIKVKEKK